jgi:hypothetical protein
MAALVVPTHRRPPGIYRAAHALRTVGAVVFALLLVFVGTVAYSAYLVATSSTESHSMSVQFASNGTVEVSGTFSLSNPGWYPIERLELSTRVANGTGVLLGTVLVGPTTVASGTTGVFPFAVAIPITPSGPAASLLTTDQYLSVRAWGNATYAYLFPVSVSLTQNRSWGAPFEGLQVSVGAPVVLGGQVSVPVRITFSDHSSADDVGTMSFVIDSANLVPCGGANFPISVAAGTYFDQTETVTLESGCSLSGGHLLLTYTTPTGTVAFPPEPLP